MQLQKTKGSAGKLGQLKIITGNYKQFKIQKVNKRIKGNKRPLIEIKGN